MPKTYWTLKNAICYSDILFFYLYNIINRYENIISSLALLGKKCYIGAKIHKYTQKNQIILLGKHISLNSCLLNAFYKSHDIQKIPDIKMHESISN